MIPARRRHSEAGGQAVLEMALVLPICIALVMNFLAVMVVVKVKTEATTATSLGAQSAISAPVSDSHDACVYAADAFFTVLFDRPGTAYTGCPPPFAQNVGSIAASATPPANRGFATGPVTLSCTTTAAANYFSGAGYPPLPTNGAATAGPPVTCTTSVTIDFNTTPLGFAVFWKPVMTVTSVVNASTVRQKCADAACSKP